MKRVAYNNGATNLFYHFEKVKNQLFPQKTNIEVLKGERMTESK